MEEMVLYIPLKQGIFCFYILIMITLLLSEFLVAPPLVSLTSLTNNSALALME